MNAKERESSCNPVCFRLIVLSLLLFGAHPSVAAQSLAARNSKSENRHAFYLRDGDRVVFYGDSITEQRLYTTYIETFCVTRFPNRRFTFITSGWSGDTAQGGAGGDTLTRLRRDVVAYHPTVVTICLGMNDGRYVAYDPEIYRTFVQSYRQLLTRLRQLLPRVRITLLTPPPYDDITRPPDVAGGYNSVLRNFAQGIQRLGREFGCLVVDVNAALVAILRRAYAADPDFARRLILDRVHPSDRAHLVIAAAVLRAWNAPPVVAEVEIDAARRRVRQARNTTLTALRFAGGRLAFTQTDAALPWPFGPASEGYVTNVDRMRRMAELLELDSRLNRYRLRVTGLPGPRYALRVNDQTLAVLSGEALARGVNLAGFAAHPANRQAREVLARTIQHNDLHFKRWREVQVPPGSAREIVPKEAQQQMEALDRQEAALVRRQREAARPRPYRMELSAVK